MRSRSRGVLKWKRATITAFATATSNTMCIFVAFGKLECGAQGALAIFETGGNRERLMRIEEIELEVNRSGVACGERRVEFFDGTFGQIITVLRLDRKRPAVGLLDPAAQREPARLAVLLEPDDLLAVALRLHAQPVEVGQVLLVVLDGRRPAVPGVVVLVEGVHELLRAQVSLAGVLGAVAGGLQIFLEDDVGGPENGLVAVVRALAVGGDVGVAAGGQRPRAPARTAGPR